MPTTTLNARDFAEILFKGYQDSFVASESLRSAVPNIKEILLEFASANPSLVHAELIENSILVLWRRKAWDQRVETHKELREEIQREYLKNKIKEVRIKLLSTAIRNRLNFPFDSKIPVDMAKEYIDSPEVLGILKALGIDAKETVEFELDENNIGDYL